MQKQSSETDNFLNALRGRHTGIDSTLGDPGLYGAMSNYTGQSHLAPAAVSNIIPNSLFGAGVGALSGAYLLPLLGIASRPDNLLRTGALTGLGTGAALSALSSIAKYYLGKGAANYGQGE